MKYLRIFTTTIAIMITTVAQRATSQQNCISFDGSSGYISTDTTAVLKTDTVTVEAWVKPASASSDQEVIRLYGSTNDEGCEITLLSGGYVRFDAKLYSDGSWQEVDYSTDIVDGNWHHIAGVICGENISLFVDGTLQDSNSGDTPLEYKNNVAAYIGEHPSNPAHLYYSGLIDEIRISNAVRYDGATYTVPSSEFVSDANTLLLYHFNENSGTTTSDASGNGIIGTLNDGVQFVHSDAPLPVEFSSLTASASNFTTVLAWKTVTEVNNAGFDVERRSMNNHLSTINSWAKVGFVRGHGTTNAAQQYSYADNIGTAGTYSYRLKQIDHNGAFTYSQVVEVSVGGAPKVFALGQNYPNPFNPSTNIRFTVPTDGRATLKVYNTLGQEVATLFDGVATADEYHQAAFDASRLSSGIYFSRLEFNGKVQTKKMVVLK